MKVTTAVICLIVSVILTGCAGSVLNADGSPSIVYEHSGVAAEDAWKNLNLQKYISLWQEETSYEEEGDVFSIGYAANRIASITQDYKWAKEAVKTLAEAKEQLPNFALATAWLGSSHALVARDFPIQGAWQIIPGPGFVRLYHVWRARSLLNQAVEQDQKNPVVRLIRAATLSAMPGILVDHQIAKDDFILLDTWNNDAGLNPEYRDILQSNDWKSSFYLLYAESYLNEGETKQALEYFTKLEKSGPTPELRNLALWKKSQIK